MGCAAIAVITIQSTAGLRGARPLDAKEVIAQAREVTLHQSVRAFKTGALGSVENVRAVGRFFLRYPNIPAVVDPVMIATRGRPRLLDPTALDALRRVLVPRAVLVTPNIPEAEALVGTRIHDLEGATQAAHAICAMGARAALVKGGHLEGPEAVDVLAIDGKVHLFPMRRIPGLVLHGGGCVLASLVAGRLAARSRGIAPENREILEAVRWAKRAHAAALHQTWNVDAHTKSSVEPAPSRKTSGGALVKSMTVLGTIPPAPESITKARP